MKNIKTYQADLHFPKQLPLILHIKTGTDKKPENSVLLYKSFPLKTIDNSKLGGLDAADEGKNFAVTIIEDERGVKSLKSKKFTYQFDTLFDEKTLVDLRLEDGVVNVYFNEVPVGTMPFTDEVKEVFARRTTFKGRVFSDDAVQIIRKADIHTHTENSFLDGIIRIPDLAEKLEYGGAITDHGNMHGTLEFYNEMKKRGKKPIIGCEVYLERLSSTTASSTDEMDEIYDKTHFFGDHMILLAKDNEGLKNLNYLVTSASEHFYSKPHVTYAELKQHNKGLIATSACIAGTLAQEIKRKMKAESYAVALAYALKGGDEKALDNFFRVYRIDYTVRDFIKKHMDDGILSHLKESGIPLTEMVQVSEDVYRDINNDDDEKVDRLNVNFKTKVQKAMVEELKQLIIDTANTNMDRFLNTMEELFGKEDFYIEIQRHQFPLEEEIMSEILTIAKTRGYKIVQGVDSHYLNKEDAKEHEIWLCLQTDKTMFEPHWQFSGTGYHVMSNDEEVELFKDIPEALDNSLEILDKCNVTIGEDKKYFLPKFPLKDEDIVSDDDFENQKEFFLKKVREGYKLRFGGTAYFKDPAYIERIKFEMDTIIKMGFPSYFTIVQDFIAWAEDTCVFEHWRDYYPKEVTDRFQHLVENDIPDWAKRQIADLDSVESREAMLHLAKEVGDSEFTTFVESATKTKKIQVGPGRGSAAGSLVAYCLGIVKVNPIPYGLLFERFLNPDRVSMPDVDVDIEDVYREEVINHVRVKYGFNCVARISTEGTAAAKAVVKDVTRKIYTCHDELVSEGLGKINRVGEFVPSAEPNIIAARCKTIRSKMGDKISKTIPETPNITLQEAMEESIDFKELYDENPQIKQIVDTAMRLEGLKKNLSIHACGVLVTDGEVVNYMPKVLVRDAKLSKAAKRTIKHWATQYQAAECEALGCLKIDFLGLRTLNMENNAINTINERIRNGYYEFDKCSDSLKNYWTKQYPVIVALAKEKLQMKVDNKMANPAAVDMIIKYLDTHQEVRGIEDIITLQTLYAQIDTPHTYIGKSTAELTNIRNNENVLTSDIVPINDTYVYKFISTGTTDGVFQIESPYMKSLMQKLFQDAETNQAFNGNVGFERLCDANALGRPGPMAEIPNYINNMLHPEEIQYEDERMKQYLDATNGIITYQGATRFLSKYTRQGKVAKF